MSRFDECRMWVTGGSIEGGYSDGTGKNAADRGGPTNFGVTQRIYDKYRALQGLPQQGVKFIQGPEVEAVYRTLFWQPIHGDMLPPPLDLVMFDAAVQHSPERAVVFLQQALGISPTTGFFGPITAAKVAKADPEALSESLIQERRQFYQADVDHDPTQAVFLKGWGRRLDSLEREIA